MLFKDALSPLFTDYDSFPPIIMLHYVHEDLLKLSKYHPVYTGDQTKGFSADKTNLVPIAAN